MENPTCPNCNCEIDGKTNKQLAPARCERCWCQRHGMRKDGRGGCSGCADERKQGERQRGKGR